MAELNSSYGSGGSAESPTDAELRALLKTLRQPHPLSGDVVADPVYLLAAEVDSVMQRMEKGGLRCLRSRDKRRAKANLLASTNNVVELFETREVVERLRHVATHSQASLTAERVANAAQLCLAFFEKAADHTIPMGRTRKRAERKRLRRAWSDGVAGLRGLAQAVSVADQLRARQLCFWGTRMLDRSVVEMGRAAAGCEVSNTSLEPANSLAPIFKELSERFKAGSVEQPISFYFSLGDTERWTVRVTDIDCKVMPGREMSRAECVLRTTPDLFTRIVRESYMPSRAEYVAGAIVAGPAVLPTLQRCFDLGERARGSRIPPRQARSRSQE